MFEVSQKRASPGFMIDRCTNVTIEVAIWTFADAKRPVHVQRQRRVSIDLELATARGHAIGVLPNDHPP